jgi:transposase
MKKVRDMFEVKAELSQGKSVSAVAREMGMDRKTVRKLALATATPERRVGTRSSKLDAFTTYLEERIAAGMTNSGVLLTEITSRGYTGKSSILRQWLTAHRPPRRGSEPVVRFETAPGEQAQIDWADCGPVLLDGCRGRLMAFIWVLSYSRMAYVEFTVGRDLGRFLRAQQHAFAQLGGVPRTTMYDTERTVTGGGDAGQPTLTARLAAFAAKYGFVPRLCRPCRAQTKGEVERPFFFHEHHLIKENTWTDLDAFTVALRHFSTDKLDQKVHGTTGERPIERLARASATRSRRCRGVPSAVFGLRPKTLLRRPMDARQQVTGSASFMTRLDGWLDSHLRHLSHKMHADDAS